VLVPLWLQTSLGYTAEWAGRVTAWQGVLAVVMSPIVARLMVKTDPRLLVSFGVFCLAAITFWRTTFNADIGFWGLAAPQIAQGFAMPFFFLPLTGLAMGAVKPGEAASAAGLMNFMRTTAGAFATSLSTTAWESLTSARHADLGGTLFDPAQTLSRLQSMGLSAAQALRQLDLIVQGQAVMLATNRVFMGLSMIFLLASACVWLAPRPKGPIPPGAGGH